MLGSISKSENQIHLRSGPAVLLMDPSPDPFYAHVSSFYLAWKLPSKASYDLLGFFDPASPFHMVVLDRKLSTHMSLQAHILNFSDPTQGEKALESKI